jgi:hypothetical protein
MKVKGKAPALPTKRRHTQTVKGGRYETKFKGKGCRAEEPGAKSKSKAGKTKVKGKEPARRRRY